MCHEESRHSLHQRLDALEKRLNKKEAEIGRAGPLPPHHREQIDKISAQANTMRKKILGTEQSTWNMVKRDLEADWDALTHSFEHWVKHVDEEYRHHKS